MTDTVDLAARAAAGFGRHFGFAPHRIAFAPGRVNLIGEHTDYNDGFVLPLALSYGTAVAFSPRTDGRVVAVALDCDDERDTFAIDDDLAPVAAGHWSNHVRGVAAALRAQGKVVSGADLAIAGNVPQGAGLSSSASLGVATGLAFVACANGDAADPIQLARAAQWSEHHFVGCACGIMDQLASACGVMDAALLIDCRSTGIEPTPVPDDAVILVVHSGVARALAESAYNERRAQCAAAARHYGVGILRDLSEAALVAGMAGLDETVFRRARHVVTENARTVAMAGALRRADYATIGRLMNASHASLRDDFAVTLPAIDALAALMQEALGDRGGARMTGGGFGGCLVALTTKDRQPALEAALAGHWRRVGSAPPLQILVRPSAGARLVAP